MQKIIDSLTDSLFAGLNEIPQWETFLAHLREATDAHHAILQCHPPGGVFNRAVYRISGQVEIPGDEQDLFRHWMSLAPPPADLVDEGKVFDVLQAYRQNPLVLDQALRHEFDHYQLTSLRALKVIERTGVEAWLFITRTGGELRPTANALLEALAPIFRGVAEVYVAREQERYRHTLAMTAARRTTRGWLTLDEAWRVIEYDENCAHVLANTAALQIGPDGTLKIDPPNLEAKVRESVRKLAPGAVVDEQVFRLSRKPWIEITVQPARSTPVSTNTPATALIYLQQDLAEDTEGRADLARAMGLSKREAELCLALGQGLRISEAADELGLTVNTARSYLRSIYSKTSTVGLPDLVRMITRTLLQSYFKNKIHDNIHS